MKLKSEKGVATLLFVFAFPFFCLLLCFVVNVLCSVYLRTRLQAASDSAAASGALVMTNHLNKIALLNWEIAEEFRKVKRIFEADSQDEKSGKTLLQQARKVQKEKINQIFEEEQKVQNDSLWFSLKSFYQHFPAKVQVSRVADVPNSISCTRDPLTQQSLLEYLSYDQINGSIFDPNNHKMHAGGGELLTRCVKNTSLQLINAVEAKIETSAPLFPSFFGNIKLSSLSTAKPYAGSISAFAQKESRNINEAISDGEFLYKTAFAPAVLALQTQFSGTTLWWEGARH